MNTSGLIRRAGVVPWSAAFALLLAGAAPAAPVTFTRTPVTNAVAQLSQKYGINIVLKGNISLARRVTFSIADLDSPGARLMAVNNIANALGADFRKVFVVSKAAPGAAIAPVEVDTNANVIFRDNTVPAADAIRAVAAVDSADVQISGAVDGTVNLSATTLTASQAAAEIARQTHTRWKAFYLVAPRGTDPRLEGTVVDRTNGGSPITASPYTYYRTGPSAAQKQRAAAAAAAQEQAAEQQANAQQQDNGQQDNGQQANAPYGYPPYGYGPYGYGPYGMYGPGLYGANDPYYVYQTGPVYNDLGYPYQTTIGGFSPGGFSTGQGLTVLPNFPYFGGYGGPIVIGGY